jgi:hypothetical protein
MGVSIPTVLLFGDYRSGVGRLGLILLFISLVHGVFLFADLDFRGDFGDRGGLQFSRNR